MSATNDVMEMQSRPVPRRLASVFEVLSRDRPYVVTRGNIEEYLAEVGDHSDPDRVIVGLQRLGWLATLPMKGVWAFVPAGDLFTTDRHLYLRAWRQRHPEAVFALAGESVADLLGYLPRCFMGTTSVWVPPGENVPHGLRKHLSVTRLSWDTDQSKELAPSTDFLHRNHLDIFLWAGGLPALGPEALTVQLAARPASFRAWPDLAGQLNKLAYDCEIEKLERLLENQTTPAKQRAAYLLDRGGRTVEAEELIKRSTTKPLPVTHFGNGYHDPVWEPRFNIVDHIVSSYQESAWKPV